VWLWVIDRDLNNKMIEAARTTISEMALFKVRAFRSGRGCCSTAHTWQVLLRLGPCIDWG